MTFDQRLVINFLLVQRKVQMYYVHSLESRGTVSVNRGSLTKSSVGSLVETESR